jgi:hypothetical protein
MNPAENPPMIEEIRNVSEAVTTGEPDLHPPRL